MKYGVPCLKYMCKRGIHFGQQDPWEKVLNSYDMCSF